MINLRMSFSPLEKWSLQNGDVEIALVAINKEVSGNGQTLRVVILIND